MLRGQALDAAIFNQAGERPFQGPVSIRRFGVTVDFPARGHRLGRGTVNVTAIPDLAMCVARASALRQTRTSSRRARKAPETSSGTRSSGERVLVEPDREAPRAKCRASGRTKSSLSSPAWLIKTSQCPFEGSGAARSGVSCFGMSCRRTSLGSCSKMSAIPRMRWMPSLAHCDAGGRGASTPSLTNRCSSSATLVCNRHAVFLVDSRANRARLARRMSRIAAFLEAMPHRKKTPYSVAVGTRLNGDSRQSMVSIGRPTPLMDRGIHDRAASRRCAGGEVRAVTIRASALQPWRIDRCIDENELPILRMAGGSAATAVRRAAHDDRSGSRGA